MKSLVILGLALISLSLSEECGHSCSIHHAQVLATTNSSTVETEAEESNQLQVGQNIMMCMHQCTGACNDSAQLCVDQCSKSCSQLFPEEASAMGSRFSEVKQNLEQFVGSVSQQQREAWRAAAKEYREFMNSSLGQEVSKGLSKASQAAKNAYAKMTQKYDDFVYSDTGLELVEKWERTKEAALNRTKEALEAAKARASAELARAEEALRNASAAAQRAVNASQTVINEQLAKARQRVEQAKVKLAEAKNKTQDALVKARNYAQQKAQAAREWANEKAELAKEKAEAARDYAMEKAEVARQQLEEAAKATKEAAEKAKERIWDFWNNLYILDAQDAVLVDTKRIELSYEVQLMTNELMLEEVFLSVPQTTSWLSVMTTTVSMAAVFICAWVLTFKILNNKSNKKQKEYLLSNAQTNL